MPDLSGILCVSHSSTMKGKPKMAFSSELLDQLLAGCERPEDILGPDGLFGQLKKALAERALGAELGHHLAQEQHAADVVGRRRRNHRNGTSPKTVLTDTGAMTVARGRAMTLVASNLPPRPTSSSR